MSTLRWNKPDDYHIRSDCGRFSVARLTVAGSVWYVAFRLSLTESQPSTELGATKLPGTASDAERLAAIHEMQQLCEAESDRKNAA